MPRRHAPVANHGNGNDPFSKAPTDRCGCDWCGRDHRWRPLDALMTLKRLLTVPSQSDRRFSEVLDREAAVR